MANPQHVAVVWQGAEAISQWRRDHPTQRLDLSGADLSGADLRGADLTGADLFGANLSGADLSGAGLFGADFFAANLIGANLIGANLFMANLFGADLTGANLKDATLHGTVVAACNLAQCVGLDAVVHQGPSSIGVDTLAQSFRDAGNRLTPELETFFLGAGVPKELLAALPRILAEVKYCSCFVCYGEPDLAFADRLVKDLKARGVSCWLYSMDATPGRRTWEEIGRRRREAEKMIVLCSAKALVRDGVLKEIEEQIDEAPDKMVPVSLDGLWQEPGFRVMRGQRDLKPFLLDRNYADFSSEATYEVSMEKLLKGLKRQA